MSVRRYLLLVVVVAVCGFCGGRSAHERPARAASQIADAPNGTFITLTPEALQHFWSQQAALRGVSNDAQWVTAMSTLFSAANWPGVDATALAFLRSFFVQVVHVGP